MPGDGVSLPTTLAQMGSVAKAQARATNHPQPSAPFADLQEQKGELQAKRVQEPSQPAPDRRIDGERDNLDKRQRRRQRRQGKATDEGADQPDALADGTANDTCPLGHLVDLRA